ncbi:MAG: Do family serine endopeptidase [Aaplasma endosymbiont of Hyalomma asiaticum]
MKKIFALALLCTLFAERTDAISSEIKKETSHGVTTAVEYERGFAGLASKLLPSVVNISTEQTIEERSHGELGGPFFGFGPGFPRGLLEGLLGNLEPLLIEPQKPRKVVSLGSGFVVDKSGLIVTNYHVIANAQEIQVKFSDNSTAKATVIGQDEKTDLAVLKVNVKKDLECAKLGDSDAAMIGEWVLAIGNPYGLGGSVSVGIISGRARDINIGTASEFLQTDAAINRGHSGGPLFNTRGEVIGVNTAIISPQGGGNVGIAFAIPSNSAARIISVLSKGEKVEHGWLGVVVQRVTEAMVDSLGLDGPRGALISDIAKDSPAERGGLRVGDVILEFNGKKIEDMPQLTTMISKATSNEQASLLIMRDGKTMSMKVIIGKMPEDSDGNASSSSEATSNVLGITVGNVATEGESKQVGVVVLRVDVKSDAFLEGIRKGDLLLAIDSYSLQNVEDFVKASEKLKKDKKKGSVLLLVKKGESPPIYIPVKIKR